MSNKNYRDVSKFLQKLRNAMVGRDLPNSFRYEPDYSARSQPPPVLPDGPSHKLAANYYYLRDARRQVETPKLIVGPEEIKKLADPSSKKENKLVTHGGVKPGNLYDPEIVRDVKRK